MESYIRFCEEFCSLLNIIIKMTKVFSFFLKMLHFEDNLLFCLSWWITSVMPTYLNNRHPKIPIPKIEKIKYCTFSLLIGWPSCTLWTIKSSSAMLSIVNQNKTTLCNALALFQQKRTAQIHGFDFIIHLYILRKRN